MENYLEVPEEKKTDKIFELTDNLLEKKSDSLDYRSQLEAEISLKFAAVDKANFYEKKAELDGDYTMDSQKVYPIKDLIEDLDKDLWKLQESKQEKFNKMIDVRLENAVESRKNRADFLGKFNDQLEQRADVYLSSNHYEKTEPSIEASKEFMASAQIGKDYMEKLIGTDNKKDLERASIVTGGVVTANLDDINKLAAKMDSKSLPTSITTESAIKSGDLFKENYKQYMDLVGIKENRDTEKERQQNLDSLYKELDSDLKSLGTAREKAYAALGISATDKTLGNEKSGLNEMLNKSNKSLEAMAAGLKDPELVKHRAEVLEKVNAGQGKAMNPIEEKMRAQHASKHKEPLEAVKMPSRHPQNVTNQEQSKNKGRQM